MMNLKIIPHESVVDVDVDVDDNDNDNDKNT
jgi:hypothetical protein